MVDRFAALDDDRDKFSHNEDCLFSNAGDIAELLTFLISDNLSPIKLIEEEERHLHNCHRGERCIKRVEADQSVPALRS